MEEIIGFTDQIGATKKKGFSFKKASSYLLPKVKRPTIKIKRVAVKNANGTKIVNVMVKQKPKSSSFRSKASMVKANAVMKTSGGKAQAISIMKRKVNPATLSPIAQSFAPVDLPYKKPVAQIYSKMNTPFKLYEGIDLIEPAVDAGTNNYYGK